MIKLIRHISCELGLTLLGLMLFFCLTSCFTSSPRNVGSTVNTTLKKTSQKTLFAAVQASTEEEEERHEDEDNQNSEEGKSNYKYSEWLFFAQERQFYNTLESPFTPPYLSVDALPSAYLHKVHKPPSGLR